MIQFNLLPDVKLQFVKTRRTKRLMSLISVGASVVALFLLLATIVTVDVVQKKSLHNLDNDITADTAQIQRVPNLNTILTVQNQLNTLTSLHDQKVVTSRLFGYIAQVTPNLVTINNMSVDFTADTISISGTAPSIGAVNTYIDTLKNTGYTTDSDSTVTSAFSQVVLSSFGTNKDGTSYSTTFDFDPTIFNSADKVTLIVPSGTTTGAQSQLFEQGAGN